MSREEIQQATRLFCESGGSVTRVRPCNKASQYVRAVPIRKRRVGPTSLPPQGITCSSVVTYSRYAGLNRVKYKV